ncbi:guanylate kinase [Proteinivorax hydrogeniformans]|uniref:Guanylate kinase n=1 Tax=Proteinivorax hydrogeniformans TaxID=1826727 RepID=A0AAU8HQZ9_9FIRM
MSTQGLLIVLSGPSGAGKGTVCKALLKECPQIQYSISATTREPRVGEVHGKNYFFTKVEDFEEKIASKNFLEWAKVYDNYYGTPRDFVIENLKNGRDVILEIDVNGAKQVMENFPEGTFIFLLPPSLEELSNRIYKRGTDSKDVIKKRLASAEGEIEEMKNYNYAVLNDKVENAVEKIKAIIVAEKCKVNKIDVVKEGFKNDLPID